MDGAIMSHSFPCTPPPLNKLRDLKYFTACFSKKKKKIQNIKRKKQKLKQNHGKFFKFLKYQAPTKVSGSDGFTSEFFKSFNRDDCAAL